MSYQDIFKENTYFINIRGGQIVTSHRWCSDRTCTMSLLLQDIQTTKTKQNIYTN